MVKINPGVYIEKIQSTSPIIDVSTNFAGFIGETEKGPTKPTLISNWTEYQQIFGSFFGANKFLPFAVQGFFLNGGVRCYISRVTASSRSLSLVDYLGSADSKTGLAGFETIDDISIIYAPNAQSVKGLTDAIIEHCEKQKNRFAIIDSLKGQTPNNITKPRSTSYAAIYYPWINIIDKVNASIRLIPPGGHIAGIYARNDIERGVHKAPANQLVQGVVSLERTITRSEQDYLYSQNVNCIRYFPGKGHLVWGARTLSSAPDEIYINVSRLLIYLKESIHRSTKWVNFEPNNEKTWAKVKMSITEFLTRNWRNGALMGTKPEEAFFVKCDRTTMTQNDIDNNRLIISIGVAIVKPAEFYIFNICHSVTK
jgi:phage tail sheath protein FI